MGFARIFAPTVTANDSPGDIAARPEAWDPNVGVFGGIRTTAGERISPQGAMRLSAYFASIRNISEDIGKMPAIGYRRLEPPPGKERTPDHIVHQLMRIQPNPEMTAFVFKRLLTTWALGWGNGYAEIERDGANRPMRLWPLHPARVRVKREDGMIVYKVKELLNGLPTTREKTVPARDIFHLMGQSGDGLVGWSIARVAAEALGVYQAMQNYIGAFFGNGAHLGLVFEHPAEVGDKGRQNIKEDLAEGHTTGSKAFNTYILEEGMKLSDSKIGIPPREAMMIEALNQRIEDVARWFRIPPHKIQHLLRATNNNIEHQSLEYVGDTIMPWTVAWEQEILRKLYLENERRTHFIEFLMDALMRIDAKTRANFYQKTVPLGIMTRNRARDKENENPIEGLDEPLVPQNLTTVKGMQKRIDNPELFRRPAGALPAPSTGSGHDDEKDKNAASAGEGRPADDSAAMFMPLFFATAKRVLDKEERALARALAKHKGDVSAFEEWTGKFYSEHRAYLSEAFGPPAFAFADGGKNILSAVDAQASAEAETGRAFALTVFRDGMPEIDQHQRTCDLGLAMMGCARRAAEPGEKE